MTWYKILKAKVDCFNILQNLELKIYMTYLNPHHLLKYLLQQTIEQLKNIFKFLLSIQL